MINQSTVLPTNQSQDHRCTIGCISWGAVIAGSLVGIGLSFLLNLFGLSIGLSAFTASKTGIVVLAVGGFIGMAIGGIVTMFFSGWVAGYLGRGSCFNRHFGVLYGLVTWCLMLILTLLLATSINRFVSAYDVTSTQQPTEIVLVADNNVSPQGNDALVTSTANQPSAGQQQKIINGEKIARGVGISLFFTFVLFFIGLVACCFGGYYGLNPKQVPRG